MAKTVEFTMHNPTDRNTDMRCIAIGSVRLYFSYHTLVAVSGPGRRRHESDFSNTTSRQMRDAGIYDWPRLEGDDLERYAMVSLTTELIPRVFPQGEGDD